MVLWDDAQLEEYVFPMIKKMSAMPASREEFLRHRQREHAAGDGPLVEGESTLPAECTPLGICDIELPPFLPKGSPVELTYEYNANQVLEVAVHACGADAKFLSSEKPAFGAELRSCDRSHGDS